MQRLAGIAVITGATGNVGQAVTQQFLEEGAAVVVAWHAEEEWRRVEASLDAGGAGRCLGIKADVTEEQQVQSLMKKAVDRFGTIDFLLNLVGGFAFGKPVWETDLGTWDKMMNLNLKSAFLCTKHVLPIMLKAGRGKIVNVSSKACVDIQPGAAAYAVAKAGIVTFTRAVREEVKGTGITVNAIMPSIIDTPATRKLMPKADRSKWVTTEQIARTLVGLCSEESGAINGSVLRLFGGL
jgi:NAD(P)-dependent dehydrogenase (short-subunit alcohol dehydrogenase family)